EALPRHVQQSRRVRQSRIWWKGLEPRRQRWLNIGVGVVAVVLMLVCITEPFGYIAQLVFVILLWALAMLVRRIPGRVPTLLMIVLSTIVSCRYLWWRYTSTLNWNNPLDLTVGLLLLAAETYAWV